MGLLSEPFAKPLNLKNYINGEWIESQGETLDVVNPATLKTIATVPKSRREELDSAVELANEAFPDWSRTPPLARARCMFRLKNLLEENFEELSRIQTMEHGKTIDESRGETRRGIENVEVASGVTSLMMGYNLEDVASGIDEYLIRKPIGVFGIIGPFNFPFMVPLWFAPYAVATGNCVVIKPSSEDPISQIKIAELVEEAGIPPGVWNVVNGGRDVVNSMLENPDVNGICFVGSTPVGKEVVLKKCGQTGKRFIAQLGAKNFLIVMPDADIEKTISACMTSFFGNSGQRCLAGANLVIVGQDLGKKSYDAFYRKFMNGFIQTAANIRVGYGLDESVQMGPLRDKIKKTKVIDFIERGLDEGASLKLDGRNISIIGNWPNDCFLNPCIFDEVNLDMSIAQEEIFGPMACVIQARNLDEAIDMIHSSPFGNSTGIFTSNGKLARSFRYRVHCGNIGINVGIPAPMAFFPFCGMKDSFIGTLHGQGQEAIRFFTESKVVIERWF